MNKFLKLSNPLIFGILCTFFVACDSEGPRATIIEVNKKMPLVEWPDSLYIADLDSILSLEPVKKGDKNKPNIAMNAHEAPTFKLPSLVTGKKDAPKAGKSNKGNENSSTTRSVIKSAGANQNAEQFLNKFSNALSALQSDPSNSGLYKVVEAKEGEDLFKLLKRTYGAGVQNLPRFYVLSTLQSVNAGVMLEHLNAGDKVRVPKL